MTIMIIKEMKWYPNFDVLYVQDVMISWAD